MTRRSERLDYEDIRSGMSLMQTVFTIAMVFGLEKVIEASYAVFIAPAFTAAPGARELELGLILVSIILLSVRFFWVPRNLNSYIIGRYDELGEQVFTRITTIHFPIALAHALVFYYVCQVFVNIASAEAATSGMASRFVVLYAGLLLLNALWLLPIAAPVSGRPGRIWAYNNLISAGAALVAFAVSAWLGLSDAALLAAACTVFIANSVFDLWKTSRFYILYEQ